MANKLELNWYGKENITANGANLTGEHPTKANEIAISNYHFDLIKESGKLGSLNDYNSVVGKELPLYFYGKNYMSYTVKMKITGVYDFGALPSSFDDLKREREASVNPTERQKHAEEFQGITKRVH